MFVKNNFINLLCFSNLEYFLLYNVLKCIYRYTHMTESITCPTDVGVNKIFSDYCAFMMLDFKSLK